MLYCIICAASAVPKQQKFVFLRELDPITLLLVIIVKRIKLRFVTLRQELLALR